MANDITKSFYNSKAWQKCRKLYIAKRISIDGGLCEKCKTEQGYIVHHKIMLTADNINDPEITLNEENLCYEWKHCHDLEEGHYYDSLGIKKLKVTFDIDGRPHNISPP